MKVFLVLVLILGAAGFAAYTYLPLTAESRICYRLDSLCNDSSESKQDDGDSCKDSMESLDRNLGPEVVENIDVCVAESDTCVEAAACLATGTVRGAAGEAMEGILRGLEGLGK